MSHATLAPYLTFHGRCEEALAFYAAALGARVEVMMRFRESPDPVPADRVTPDWGDKVMHASLRVGGDAVLMATDGCGGEAAFRGVSLALNFAEAADARRAFDALAADGTITMPLGPTFWSPLFGMATDRFGVSWMVGVQPK